MSAHLDGLGVVTNGAQRVLTLRIKTATDPVMTRTVQAILRTGDSASEAAASLRLLADRLIQPIRGGE